MERHVTAHVERRRTHAIMKYSSNPQPPLPPGRKRMASAEFEPNQLQERAVEPGERDEQYRPGTNVAGRYRLERLIGQGAIAWVYEATHVALGRRVAIKIIKHRHAGNPEVIARFEREAKSVARLQSPHVATVLDIGEHGGAPFIAMEFLDGKDLRALIEERGPMSKGDVAEILIQTCAALAEAHSLGIVHRDIKPENMFMIDPDQAWRSIKILDFGIAHVTGSMRDVEEEDTPAVDRAPDAKMIGSPHYMSPEQIKSSPDVDGRTDLWSLGVVARELLTGGERPFGGENLTALLSSILCDRPRAPTDPLHDRAFLAVIDRCLEKSADKRYASAADFAWALFPHAPQRTIHAVERARQLTPSASFAVTEVIRQRDENADRAELARASNVRSRLQSARTEVITKEAAEERHASATTNRAPPMPVRYSSRPPRSR